MTHASARIRQSSCHSRLLSAAGPPKVPAFEKKIAEGETGKEALRALKRQRAGRWLVSHCPVLAVTYRARSTAAIGVQLVKDVLSLVNGIGWPARVSWRPGHFAPSAVMPAGSDSGIARVIGQVLRPAAVTLDPRRADTDALHRQTSRHLRRPVGGSTGRPR